MSYLNALKVQEELWATRSSNFKDTLLIVEHVPQVRDKATDMLMDEKELTKHGIEVHHVGRGGNITWHGPGQLVGYPVMYLGNYQKNVRWYFTHVQKAIQQTIGEYGIKSGIHCDPSLAGVWVGEEKNRKIAALGVQLSRWYTMHGFAININNDMFGFEHIIPCGIKDPKYSTTTMAKELNREITVEEVTPVLIKNFGEVFGARMVVEK